MKAWLVVVGIVLCVGYLAMAGDTPVSDREAIAALTKRVDDLTLRVIALERVAKEPKTAQAAGETGKIIRAKAFVVEDANGNERAVLELLDGGSGLSLSDENGKTRVALALTKTGPAMDLSDENGNSRAALQILNEGPVLSLSDENQKLRVILMHQKKGGTMFTVLDENGKPLWKAP